MWPFGDSEENENKIVVDQHIENLHMKTNSTIIIFAIVILVYLIYKIWINLKSRILKEATQINMQA